MHARHLWACWRVCGFKTALNFHILWKGFPFMLSLVYLNMSILVPTCLCGWVADSVESNQIPRYAASDLIYHVFSHLFIIIRRVKTSISKHFWNILQSTLFIPALDTTTKFVIMTICMNVTKASLKRWQLMRIYAKTLHKIFKQQMFWLFVRIASERQF